jgi:hypothetical protein
MIDLIVFFWAFAHNPSINRQEPADGSASASDREKLGERKTAQIVLIELESLIRQSQSGNEISRQAIRVKRHLPGKPHTK